MKDRRRKLTKNVAKVHGNITKFDKQYEKYILYKESMLKVFDNHNLENILKETTKSIAFQLVNILTPADSKRGLLASIDKKQFK